MYQAVETSIIPFNSHENPSIYFDGNSNQIHLDNDINNSEIYSNDSIGK